MTREEKLAKYGAGPWVDEPDRVEWRAHGHVCLIVRGPHGSLCGYVGVTPGHPWHGKPLAEVEESVDAHGGLTYAAECQGNICHVPAPGEPEHLYWLGFDCGHAGDFVPVLARLGCAFHDDQYRTVEYVRAAVERLAVQARLVEA